jgi:tripartite-type tricarboxylate transporter receptor subunit TctC
MKKIGVALSAFLLAGAALVSLPAAAQDVLPKKQITIVVGFPVGGGIDTTARIVAQKLAQNLGRSVVVLNRPGADGNIGQQVVVQSEPDGSTILLGSIGSLAINPHLMKFSYDPVKDLAPLTLGVIFPNVLVVRPELGVRSLQDFIQLARNDPGKISFASGGAGTASHMAGEMLNQRAGLNILHVPYKGGSPAITDLLGGQVSAYYATPSSALPFLESKKLVALATTGLERVEQLPNVPTIAESGFPGFNATNWYAFVAPGKTPPAVIKRWNVELVNALSAPDVRAALIQHGLIPKPGTPEELADFISSESKSWAKVIKDRHITVE